MKDVSARKALETWRDEGLLSADQIAALEASLDRQLGTAGRTRAVTIFASIGAILVGLGILLFVGSNWSRMGPLARAVVLGGTYASTVIAASVATARGQQRVARALWFLSTLSFGANIFFVGQIFNFTLTYWQGPLLWLIGALAMGFAIESRLHAWVAMPLALLTLGWLGGGSGWFFNDQYEFLWSDTGLKPLFPIVGLGFVGLALLARRTAWHFASRTWFAWGVWLVALPLAISTITPGAFTEIFAMSLAPHQIGILIGTSVVVGLALWRAEECGRHRVLLAALMAVLVALLLPQGTRGPWLRTYLDGSGAFLVYAIAVFGAGLLTIWTGLEVASGVLVNVGMGTASIVIAAQYVSWSFRLLDRSFAFILGGVVLIASSILIERQRRRLLAQVGA